MLILLPPSEGKRAGGEPEARLALSELRFDRLTPQRADTLRAVSALAADVTESLRALRLRPERAAEAAKNLVVQSSPVMPAALRLTGVLYDALDTASLPDLARDFLGRCVVIHTALLGPVGAMDRIPDYRLSADSRIPGLVLKRVWSAPVADELARVPGLIIDARSKAYAALGPAPRRADSVALHVVSEGPGGVRRALNHFNKTAKGEFVRALALGGEPEFDLDGLLAWGRREGFRLELDEGQGQRRLLLVV